ncbi:myo-inositol-1(or 4)-monophosphatase [Rhodopirellula rubra]|uniref:Myo-inositol-1(Or 4)-monophosphatase n=2 Tax=Aporhodopirellula rubra TaxID=980271 RepID=A0A7W5DXJ1_9BACT|nr:myo-inositol-1(or 4)-monophosphatase [Aporhodopirellula rubra]
MEQFQANPHVLSEDGKDIKTLADLEAESIILSKLSETKLPIIAEESASDSLQDSLHWLVDPLDGTMNFTRGFPVFAVSIALWDGLTPVLGVILDLATQNLYTGIAGHASWMNQTPIRVSSVDSTDRAILATGFPSLRNYDEEKLTQFVGHIQAFKKIRMIGSAALSMANVAKGVFDAYFEEDIMLWDIAAGAAIVDGAGGRLLIRPGNRTHSVHAIATNGQLNFE